jgi:Pentapeptide repeats (8 copies)
LITGLVALFVVAAFIIFIWLPGWMINDDEFVFAGPRLKAENDIRTVGLQFLAGGVLALGALFTGISLVFNRESQITERFTRAADQLGNKEPDIRVGGIYGLECIARDSRRDHTPVMEILITFVKEHAKWSSPYVPLPLERPPADIRAALIVLGRRNTGHEREPLFIELSGTLLTRADLSDSDFSGSAFLQTHLEGANLIDADFSNSALVGAYLDDATLARTDLNGAALDDASCRRAEFSGADLRDANLTNADLRETTFVNADLRGTSLDGAQLEQSTYNTETRASMSRSSVGPPPSSGHSPTPRSLNRKATYGQRATAAEMMVPGGRVNPPRSRGSLGDRTAPGPFVS